MARRLSAAERDARFAQVISLRRVRVPFDAIGKQLTPPVSAARACQIYQEALTYNPLTAIQVDQYRVEAIELCDLAVRQLMTIAMEKSTTPRTRIEAWSSARSWEEHGARLRNTYAPVRTEVVTMDFLDRQIAALEAEIGVRASHTGDAAVRAEIVEVEANLGS